VFATASAHKARGSIIAALAAATDTPLMKSRRVTFFFMFFP
jgi:hypothetical protein